MPERIVSVRLHIRATVIILSLRCRYAWAGFTDTAAWALMVQVFTKV